MSTFGTLCMALCLTGALAGSWSRGLVAQGQDHEVLRQDLIKKVPKATSMVPSEFIAFGSAGTTENDIVKSRALTYVVMMVNFNDKNSEVRIKVEGLTPDRIKKHCLREGLATVVHVENVKKLELLSVVDGIAHGTIHFDSPMAKGKFHFRANKGKASGQWRFTEFVLFGTKTRTRLHENGRWNDGKLTDDEVSLWKAFRAKQPLKR